MTRPRPTTIVDAPRLSRKLGVDVVLASETLQYTGSFKFRAAYNVASNVKQSHIITASSGNFGQAIAYACSLFKKRCTVVMPTTAPRIKVDAVREYGAEVDLVDLKKKGRLERLAELAREFPDAYVASPYDDPLVIEGNAGLADELFALGLELDFIIAPIGGGGLTSGLVKAVERSGKKIQVLAAEPTLSNDAAQSFRAGHIVALPDESSTIADGARVLRIGDRNWEILSQRPRWSDRGLGRTNHGRRPPSLRPREPQGRADGRTRPRRHSGRATALQGQTRLLRHQRRKRRSRSLREARRRNLTPDLLGVGDTTMTGETARQHLPTGLR